MNPLTNEKTFKMFLNSLSCNGCIFFLNKKCTEKNAEAHNVDKSFLVQDALNRYLHSKDEFSKEWAENIDDHFICEEYQSKDKKVKLK